jgi:hypothetical protein
MRSLAFIATLVATSASAGEICLKAPYDAAQSTAQNELSSLYTDINASLTRFPSLSDTLSSRSPDLCFSDQGDAALGYLDVDRNRIYLRRALPRDLQIGVLLHEIRHLDQLRLGACPSDDLAMAEYARATFALEADASAISLLIAWDLKQQGDPGVWSALSAWDTQSDIADRFAAEMNASRGIDIAVATAFDQWYASDLRRAQYYVLTCSEYLDRQDASKALPQYQLLPGDFYAGLCRLPDGRNYPCSEPADPLR